jgi:hypothetical protein
MATSFRYEPLGPARFPVGDGPFHARGLAYVSAFKYVDGRLPGGRAAFLAALGAADPFAPFYEQIFLVGGEYDVSPLLRLYEVAALIEGVFVGRLIENLARRSAESDAQGVWKSMLKGSTPEDMATRTHLAFNRYFPPCRSVALAARPGRFEGELLGLPACMVGLYGSCTAGFIAGAVALAGASAARTDWERPVPEGTLGGVPLERVRFAVTWGMKR